MTSTAILGAAMMISAIAGEPALAVTENAIPAVVAEEPSVSDDGRPKTHPAIPNPHSDLIFRATGATSCRDCHQIGRDGGFSARVQDNELVQSLRAKAKGVHGPGRFADCLRCHAGGDKGVEKYRKP